MDHVPASSPVPLFLEQSIPVELASEFVQLEVEGHAVRVHCATQHYEPEVFDYYGTLCETILTPATAGHPLVVQLDFCTDAIVRIRTAPEGEQFPPPTPMVVGDFDGPTHFQLHRAADRVTIETALLRLEIVHEPLQLLIYDRDDNLIWATRALDIACLRRPEVQWNPAENRWLFYHRYAYPLGWAAHGATRRAFLSSDLHYDEHIYGFGEGFGRLDKRETRQRLWNVEAFGNASPGAYKNIPFFMSTRGYGLFLNTSHAVTAHVGDLESTALSLIVDDATNLDLYWIFGPHLAEILPRYTAITGAPALPPKWSFGLWMGRISYNRQEQVEQVAADLRGHRIPCDVIHIDTDWYEHDWECDLEFGRSKFPDPAGMLARLRTEGFRVSLWQWPNLIVGTQMFQEGRDQGYLARRSNGHPYLFPGFAGDAGFIDYTNPAAVAWVQEKFRTLFEQGVAAIKVDFGEGAAPAAHYDGAPSAAMHNLYALLYNQAIFAVTEAFHGAGNAVIWARAAWAGSQRYPLHWSGDGLARFEDMACVVRSALSFGLSGFPFYSHDIGGFSGLPSPELYVRWAQFGLFSSHARCHGAPPREPWAYGAGAEAIFRRYAELRYRLLPYIYSEAVYCSQHSEPFLRPLVLDWQDDPTTFTIDDQYLFGRSMLVAPILDERNRRRVYLPAGRWVAYWTKEVLAGGRWIEVDAPLDVLPIYVKAGALIPYGPLMQHTDALPLDPLTLELYLPDAAGAYTLFDEAQSPLAMNYRRQANRLTLEVGAAPGVVEVVVFGASVQLARCAGQRLAVTHDQQGGSHVRFDGRSAQSIEFFVEDTL